MTVLLDDMTVLLDDMTSLLDERAFLRDETMRRRSDLTVDRREMTERSTEISSLDKPRTGLPRPCGTGSSPGGSELELLRGWPADDAVLVATDVLSESALVLDATLTPAPGSSLKVPEM